jgi:C-terminal processing protease CtpA/Prc
MIALAMLALATLPVAATAFEDASGLSLEKTGAELAISAVAKGSAGEEAGFTVGDLIVHVDGKQCADMDAQKLSDWLKEKGGTTHHVAIRRDGKTKLRNLKLKQPL